MGRPCGFDGGYFIPGCYGAAVFGGPLRCTCSEVDDATARSFQRRILRQEILERRASHARAVWVRHALVVAGVLPSARSWYALPPSGEGWGEFAYRALFGPPPKDGAVVFSNFLPRPRWIPRVVRGDDRVPRLEDHRRPRLEA